MTTATIISMNHSFRYQRELEGDSTTEAATLAWRALALIACGKATHDTFRGLRMGAIAGLIEKLETRNFWLGKCSDGRFIRYLSEKPIRVRGCRAFVGAVGPFLSPLGAAYYARLYAENPIILTPQQAEHLACEDHEGAWPFIREQLLAEMTMTTQEIDDFLGDMAAEYDPI